MKARLNPFKRLYWWWSTRQPARTASEARTFWEWLNANNLALCTWELVGDGDEHTHDLVQLEMEQAEAVFHRYLKHYLKGRRRG
jgi:hypothetical protein